MFFRKAKTESLSEKFVRLLSFRQKTAETTASMIEQLKRDKNSQLALENYSYMIDDYCDIALMQWRRGEDPRRIIGVAHQAYQQMISYRNQCDPDHNIPMDQITGITDWDLVYSLFWLVGKYEDFSFNFPNILSERYFCYSRFILHRVTETSIPDEISEAVAQFRSESDELVDRNFSDLLTVLDSETADSEIYGVIARISDNWQKRRKLDFYQNSAPVLSGFDASNDLNVDYQLGIILKKKNYEFSDSPHFWRWD